jgi:EAL domain-containing protein (putative c-di-GMP-specific phosphodiesterase class I)/CheY-like chemotaxis protein
MNSHIHERLKMESDLRNALERAEFVLHYQPQADLCSGQVVGMEALIRWNHPERGMILPGSFIGFAEKCGLIEAIGAWVLRTACAQVRQWQDMGLGAYRIGVNLSALQLSSGGFAQLVETALAEAGLPAERLNLELPESLLVNDVENVVTLLNRLNALGVQLTIDDFGTGYSSLAYLKRFPIDVLKIDRSFVKEILTDPHDAAISDAIISMAHSLGIRVIAEGIESEGQCEFLARNMCDEMQGQLFAPALPAQQVEALLRAGRCLPKHLLRMHRQPRRLLLVDDEPSILSALKRQMRRDGYEILTATGGREGLDLLARQSIDVIVSDQRMPGMTGVEFLRTVKTLYPETVRIVLSGFTELQSVTDAVNEGAIYKFLTKPWDDDQLREHVAKAFEHKEMADENSRLNLEVRAANQELAHANRRLEELLQQQQQQIQRGEVTLDIVREALLHVPLPVIGVDDDGVVVFVNTAAQALFAGKGSLLGGDAAALMPEVWAAAGERPGGAAIDGATYDVMARAMGHGTQSRGRLIILTRREAADVHG